MKAGKKPAPKIGRVKPYTAIGIKRAKCLRCGKPAVHQWQVCSLGNRWCPICDLCDVLLNWGVLDFMRVPGRVKMIELYAETQGLVITGAKETP